MAAEAERRGAAGGRPPSVLVVDDEQVMRTFLEKALRRLGYEVTLASDADSARAAFVPRRYSLVLSDVRMPGRSGLDLLDELLRIDPTTPVVIMSAFGSIDVAVEAVRRGAADFVTKPIEVPHLQLVVERTLEQRETGEELMRLRAHADEREGLGELIGASLAMKRVYTLIDKVAPRDLTVLILGETGTGKGLCARTIHQQSPRAQGRFQVVNCSALQETLLESELFGHEKGAFTGADKRRLGHFEVAAGGTLFLDEVGDTPLAVQAKLLNAIQEKVIVRVGGTDPIKVDVRILAATNKDLAAAVARGEFREDLYYRLSAFPIELPPLRARPEDIPLLAEATLRRAGLDLEVAPDAARALERSPWPGNVRQLENALTRAGVLAGEGPIALEHLGDVPGLELPQPTPAGLEGSAPLAGDADIYELPIRDARAAFERRYLERLLAVCRGNVSEVARRAGMGRASLHEKIHKLGLEPDAFRGSQGAQGGT